MKKFGVVASVFALMILLSGFVSAGLIEDFVNGFAEAVKPVASALLGNTDAIAKTAVAGISEGEVLFVKVLMLFIVMTVAYVASKKLPFLEGQNPFYAFLIAFAVSVLGVRYITTPELIETLWLPTSVFAVAITAIIPFAIFFYFVEGFDSSAMRKFSWTTYAVIFFYFGIARWNDLLITGDKTPLKDTLKSYAALYIIVAAISIVLILFDRPIHSMLRRSTLNKIKNGTNRAHAARLLNEIDDLYRDLAKTTDPTLRTSLSNLIKTKEDTLKTHFSS